MNAEKIMRQETPFAEKAAAVAAWLVDKKANDVVAFDLSKENTLFEAAVIASATSVRHGQGLAEHVLQSAKAASYEFLHMEGTVAGQWILLDLNEVVVHIFQPETRKLYRLDDLWAASPVLADTRGSAASPERSGKTA